MKRRILSALLVVVLALTLSTQTFAAEAPTYEQRINALEITPREKTTIQKRAFEEEFLNASLKIAKEDVSNYEKLKSAFLYVSEYLSKDGSYNCNIYRGYLLNALYLIGFEVYWVDGLTRTKDPNYQLPYYPNLYHNIKGWTQHEWVGLVIDGESNAVITDYYEPDPKALSRGAVGVPKTFTVDNFWGYCIGFEGKPLDIKGEVLYLDANLYAEHGMSFEQTFLTDPTASNIYSFAYLNKPIF